MPALTTPQIVGRIALPDDANPTNAVIRFTMTGFDTDEGADVVVVNVPVDAPIDAGGDIDVDLWPNPSGIRATLYAVQYVQRRADARDLEINLGRIEVPAGSGPYNLNDLLPIDPNSPANPSIQQMIDELRARDDQEEAARISADNSLISRINAEQSARIAGDNTLDARIDNLSSGIFYAGTFDPAGGAFPAASLRGGTYRAISAGTVGGQAFDIGDRITAKVDGASTSVFAGNWDLASTSAEVADLDAKFSDTLRFYGAVGDGVANDTAAVTAADAAAGPYIDMEGLTYITTINLSTLTKKYYNGTMYGQNSSGNQSVLANETPYQEAEIRQLGTKSRFFNWEGSDILWLGTSIPRFGSGDGNGYPELSADALNASVTNLAWAGSHATFYDLADIDPEGDINQIKALSMTDADVAAGLALYGSGSVFDDSYDAVTKASSMTLEHRIAEPFQATDFDVVVLDHNHNDRRDEWGTLTPESTTITGISKAAQAVVAVSSVGTIAVGDFVAMRQTGITGLDYAFGRVQAVAGSNVTIDYSTTGMVGSFASGTLYKLDRSTVFGAFEACIYAVKNSSLRYGSGNVHVILCGAPSEFTGDTPDNDIRSVAVAIRQVSDKWGFPFFDIATALSVNEQDHIVYFPDGVHPSTPETREVVSRYWVEWMRGGRDLALNKSDFVASGGVPPVSGGVYTYDRFSGGAVANGQTFGDVEPVLSDDFSGTLAAYTLIGNAPTIVPAPWDAGENSITTFTDAGTTESYIKKSDDYTTGVSCEFDFQFSEILAVPTSTRIISLAHFRGDGGVLNYSVQMIVQTSGDVRLRVSYINSDGDLISTGFSPETIEHGTKYNLKFEVVPDIGSGNGWILLYLNGELSFRFKTQKPPIIESSEIRVGQVGSNYGGDMTVHIGNIVFGDVPAYYAGGEVPRTAFAASVAKSGGAGTVFSMGGFQYVVQSGGTACTDLGVTDIAPFGNYSPMHFGAVGDGVTDDGAAINRALAAYKSAIESVDDFLGATKFVGYGRSYMTTVSLNFTEVSSWGWSIEDMVIIGKCTGKTVLDMIGSRGGNTERVTVYGDPDNMPRIGIMAARSASGGQEAFCDNISHDCLQTRGYFSISGVYFYGQETTTYTHCAFWNYNPTGHAAIYTSEDLYPVESDYVTAVTGRVSYINNTYITCDHRYVPIGNAFAVAAATQSNPMVITTTATHNFVVGENVVLTFEDGMTEAYGIKAEVTAATGTTITLGSVDSSGFSAFTGRARVTRPQTVPTVLRKLGNDHSFLGCYSVAFGQPQVETDVSDGLIQVRDQWLFEGGGQNSCMNLSGVATATRELKGYSLETYQVRSNVSVFSSDATTGVVILRNGKISVPTSRITSPKVFDDETKFSLMGVDVSVYQRDRIAIEDLAGFDGTLKADDSSGIIYGPVTVSSAGVAPNEDGVSSLGSETSKWADGWFNTIPNVLAVNSLGYAAGEGAGGVVVQSTSKSTTVTLNNRTGRITTHNAALASGSGVAFEVSCNKATSNSIVVVSVRTPRTKYVVSVTGLNEGSFNLYLQNVFNTSLSEAVIINYAIIDMVPN